jgi:hypothetical protein
MPAVSRRPCRSDRVRHGHGTDEVGRLLPIPDGVLYSLLDSAGEEKVRRGDKLGSMSSRPPEPIVEEVLRFENLPLEDGGRRRAVVRWSDGTESPALACYPDEILSPVDHVGRQ